VTQAEVLSIRSLGRCTPYQCAFKRPDTFFSSVTVHLTSPDALNQFKDAVTSDPRLKVDVSEKLITTRSNPLGCPAHYYSWRICRGHHAIAQFFGALNTMYLRLPERGREIATMRALGFGSVSVIIPFFVRSPLDLFSWALVGLLAVLRPQRADDRCL